MMHRLYTLTIVMTMLFCGSSAWAQGTPANSSSGTAAAAASDTAAKASKEPAQKSKFFSSEDGWLDISGFLDEQYGFLPVALLITEPATGYGAGLGLAFVDKPFVGGEAGYNEPDITLVGGLWTENNTWGALLGDQRYWLKDQMQTTAALGYFSINLDFYGIGDDAKFHDNPLRYNLESGGGLARWKYRLSGSRFWAGIGYSFWRTKVTVNLPEDIPRLPEKFERTSDVGSVQPTVVYDSRNNVFTPTKGTWAEVLGGIYSHYLGGDDEFQSIQLVLLQFIPLPSRLYLGLRADGTANFGDSPFYMLPSINLRGAAMMRYQGDEVAQLETELRWQCWNRWSVLGFVGYGWAWNDFERLDNVQSVLTGGPGFRYEIARPYGIHAGMDFAWSKDDFAFYIQVGSAWTRF